MLEESPSSILFRAAESIHGIAVTVAPAERDLFRQKLYACRRELALASLDCLQFRYHPQEPGTILITKGEG